jgi:Rrf2 family protein
MKMTRAASYAIHAMVHMATSKPDVPLASHEIAKAHHIPERFLLKVLKPMVSAGLLTSVKGPRGGYRLAKAPGQITLLEVIEAVEGPIRGRADFESDAASNGLHDRLESVCTQVAERTRRHLQTVKLSHLAMA